MSATPPAERGPSVPGAAHAPQSFTERLRHAFAGPKGWLDGAPVTRALLYANVAVFAVEILLARRPSALAATPSPVMLAMGANYAAATIAEHRVETLLTSCFLHFSILHIVFNLYALRQIGPPIERNIDPARMAPMYVVSGIVGSGASAAAGWLSGEERLSAGASGAICGIIGAALVLGLRAQGWKSPLAWAMGRWLGLLLVIQLVGDLMGLPATFDNTAHFGGAATGAAFAASWRKGALYTATSRKLIMGLSAGVVLAAFAAVAWRDTHDPFAMLRAPERYEMAREFLRQGRCKEAGDAIHATARLVPRAPEVTAIEQDYEAACGKM